MSIITIPFKEVYTVNGVSIVSADVSTIKFKQFAAQLLKAVTRPDKSVDYDIALTRIRMIDQTTLVTEKGEKVKMGDLDLINLPIRVARAIQSSMNLDQGTMGKVLSDKDADGISSPILYQLGDPINLNGGDPITELEFLAKTYGDLETVLCEDQPIQQVVELIANVAKPTNGLMALPSWAVDNVSIADGIKIANDVLPRFLE